MADSANNIFLIQPLTWSGNVVAKSARASATGSAIVHAKYRQHQNISNCNMHGLSGLHPRVYSLIVACLFQRYKFANDEFPDVN